MASCARLMSLMKAYFTVVQVRSVLVLSSVLFCMCGCHLRCCVVTCADRCLTRASFARPSLSAFATAQLPRAIAQLHRAIAQLHRAIAQLHRAIAQLHRATAQPHRAIAQLHRATAQPHRAIAQPHRAIAQPHRAIAQLHRAIAQLPQATAQLPQATGMFDLFAQGHDRLYDRVSYTNHDLTRHLLISSSFYLSFTHT